MSEREKSRARKSRSHATFNLFCFPTRFVLFIAYLGSFLGGIFCLPFLPQLRVVASASALEEVYEVALNEKNERYGGCSGGVLIRQAETVP